MLATCLELLKYTAPSIVMLIAVYLIIDKFLVSEIKRKQIALFHDTQSFTLPLRLQAYERLTLFVERLHPRTLVPRIYDKALSAGVLREMLIMTINTEFEHNLSQQLYVSKQAWQTIVSVKDQELAMIGHIADSLPADAPARALHDKIVDYVLTAEGELPGDIALQILADEAKVVLSYGNVPG